MSAAGGYVVGPLVAKPLARALSMDAVFFVAAATATVSSVLVLARLDRDPPATDRRAALEGAGERPEPALRLLARIKTCCFATFAYGYFQASVVLFLPLYLVESKHIAREMTILVPSFFAAASLPFSDAAGRL